MRFSLLWLLLPLVACRADNDDTASVLVIDDAASADTVLSTLTDEGAVWIDPASGEVELILASPSPGALYPAAVSPDGRRAAVCTLPPEGPDGSRRDTVMEGALASALGEVGRGELYCGVVRYSPDSSRYVWNEQDEDGRGVLRVGSVERGAAEPADGAAKAGMLFSPIFVLNGTAVAGLTSDNSDTGPIVLADVATGEVRTLQSTWAHDEIVPSPDGRSIATVYRESLLLIDVERDEAVEVWAGNVDAEVCSRQDPDLSLDCFVEPHNPQFSPDGSKLVFGARPTFGDNYNAELRVLDLATGAVTVLAEREYHHDYAVFGHDNETVYWVRDFDTIVAGRSGAGEPEVVYRGAVSGLSVAWPGLAR